MGRVVSSKNPCRISWGTAVHTRVPVALQESGRAACLLGVYYTASA